MRRLSRWHPAISTRTGLSFAAVAIALAIVGALILETGILAHTPNGTASPDARDYRAAAYLQLPGDAGVSGHDPDARTAQRGGGHAPFGLDATPELPGVGVPHPVHSITIPQDSPIDVSTGADLYPTAPEPAPAKPSVVKLPARPSRPATPAAPAQSSWNVAPIVTWYGPGFYGNRTACGQRYTRTIIGVAHKTLPCGTLIQFRWHGITAVARVIDRGPYASSDYVFDFSAALACDVFRPRGAQVGCFTRHNVKWRVIGRRQN